jgi:hypothetical protein
MKSDLQYKRVVSARRHPASTMSRSYRSFRPSSTIYINHEWVNSDGDQGRSASSDSISGERETHSRFRNAMTSHNLTCFAFARRDWISCSRLSYEPAVSINHVAIHKRYGEVCRKNSVTFGHRVRKGGFGTGSRDDVVAFIPGDVYGAHVEGVHPPAFGPQEVA